MRGPALVVALSLAGCGGSPPRPLAPAIALAADFDGYEAWPAFELAAETGAPDAGPHEVAFKRRVFINQLPPSGARSFPVGTLIVKEEPEDTLAMAKRGGAYNAQGAAGWEWMKLQRSRSGAIVIVWRGLGPPADDPYKARGVACNDGHGAHVSNDSVLTPNLQP